VLSFYVLGRRTASTVSLFDLLVKFEQPARQRIEDRRNRSEDSRFAGAVDSEYCGERSGYSGESFAVPTMHMDEA
jgi:hypothetical protein